ncbi:MAG: pyridoxamine 5'-phosphate oxidase family protein [Acidobacteriota bacterium]
MKIRGVPMLLLAVALVPSQTPPGLAQPTAREPSRAEIVAAARTIASKARYATFVTLDETGHPQSRIVDPFVPEGEFTIWIATNARTRKVAQLGRDSRVTLTYFDREAEHYVTVLGVAALVRDPAEKAKRWKAEWAAFYKDGPRGDDYLLIRVRPTRLEVVAPSLGIDTDPVTWRPAVVEMGR